MIKKIEVFDEEVLYVGRPILIAISGKVPWYAIVDCLDEGGKRLRAIYPSKKSVDCEYVFVNIESVLSGDIEIEPMGLCKGMLKMYSKGKEQDSNEL